MSKSRRKWTTEVRRGVDGVWRTAWGVNAEFWRCRRGSIFCGGTYNQTSSLCKNCESVANKDRRRGSRRHVVNFRRQVLSYFVSGPNALVNRRTRLGREVLVNFCRSLFQNKKQIMVSYQRRVWELATGRELPYHLVVVNRSRRLFPQYEDLIVVARGASKDAGVALELSARDRMASD